MAKKVVEEMSEIEKAYVLGFVDMALVSECGLEQLMRLRRQVPALARLLSREGMDRVSRAVGSDGLSAISAVRFDVEV